MDRESLSALAEAASWWVRGVRKGYIDDPDDWPPRKPEDGPGLYERVVAALEEMEKEGGIS